MQIIDWISYLLFFFFKLPLIPFLSSVTSRCLGNVIGIEESHRWNYWVPNHKRVAPDVTVTVLMAKIMMKKVFLIWQGYCPKPELHFALFWHQNGHLITWVISRKMLPNWEMVAAVSSLTMWTSKITLFRELNYIYISMHE